MPVDLNLIQGAYLGDLLDQPQALQRTVDGLEDSPSLRKFTRALARGEYSRVVLTGMGSSFHALYPLHLQLSDAGIASQWVETSELIHYQRRLLDARTLLIAVSQSGRSAETIRLLALTAGQLPIIAVTNDPASPLAAQSDAMVLMCAGEESTVSCKTYVASLVALEWLGAVLLDRDLAKIREELRQIIPAGQSYLAQYRSHVERFVEMLQGVSYVFVIGRGPSLAAAGNGGLVLKESAHFPVEGMSSAAFRHGPYEMLGPHILVMVFAGDATSAELNRRLAEDIRAAGGRSALVAEDAPDAALRLPRVPAAVRPVAEILPLQMFSLALAACNGHQAGRFERAAKITATE